MSKKKTNELNPQTSIEFEDRPDGYEIILRNNQGATLIFYDEECNRILYIPFLANKGHYRGRSKGWKDFEGNDLPLFT